jgi:hypothetical protein
MRAATSAANTLRAAINRLQSKTITVTTRYRSVGSPSGRARGGIDVVNRPTDIHVGEGGRPELVSVMPLTRTGAAAIGGAGTNSSIRERTAKTVTTRTGTGTATSPTPTVAKQFRAANGFPQLTSNSAVARGSGGGAGQQQLIIHNQIMLDSREMENWIRKVANKGYTNMR